MCVISVRGLSSLDAWCGALLAFSQFSLALHDVFTNHFVGDHFAAKGKKEKHFCSSWKKIETFLQPMEKIETF